MKFYRLLNMNFDGEVLIAIGNSFFNIAPKYRIDFKPYFDVFIYARNRSQRVDCLVLWQWTVEFKENKLWKQSGATI